MFTEMDTTQRLVSAFKQQKCWMITPLAEQINYSIPSVRRFLAKIGYYSSFTHNGRWYTLASIPRFKQDGLWFHQKIGFSCEGSLTRTLVRLTEQSPMGLTADQIGEKLQCRCHAVLVKLYRKGRLQRQKKAGRTFIWQPMRKRLQPNAWLYQKRILSCCQQRWRCWCLQSSSAPLKLKIMNWPKPYPVARVYLLKANRFRYFSNSTV